MKKTLLTILAAALCLQSCQQPTRTFPPDSLVLAVQADLGENCTVWLPLTDSIDCTIDWGDGQKEQRVCHFNEETPIEQRIHHQYDSTGDTRYTIQIQGKVKGLSSNHEKMNCITDVLQWGDTGLTNLETAFMGNPHLKSISRAGTEHWGNIPSFGSYDRGTFYGCTALSALPDSLFAYCPGISYFESTFKNCTALTTIPGSLFANCDEVTEFIHVFSGCTALQSIPARLFEPTPKVQVFSHIFSGCTALTAIPARLFAHCPEVTDFIGIFENCTALKSIPDGLFSACPKVMNFENAFNGCPQLDDWDLLPKGWKTDL